jgi:hypothetical protein
MEQNHISSKKRKEREKKLERVSLYWEWEEREPCEAHFSWEQWQKLRQLRKQNHKTKIKNTYVPENPQFSAMTAFGVLIKRYNDHLTQEEFDKYIWRLNCEYQILNKHSTKELLYYYKMRWNHFCFPYCNDTCIKFSKFMIETFKYVLDGREHLPRPKKKTSKERVKYQGKKDKRNGRKNPTNRR